MGDDGCCGRFIIGGGKGEGYFLGGGEEECYHLPMKEQSSGFGCLCGGGFMVL